MNEHLLNIMIDELTESNQVFIVKLKLIKDYIKLLEKENKELKEFKAKYKYDVDILKIDEIEKLKAENKKLRDALEFYADPEHWGNEEINSWNDYEDDCDRSNGALARKVLKENYNE